MKFSGASVWLALMFFVGQAQAFDDLTEAQAWIYDRSHLANTSQGQVLHYHYTGLDADSPDAVEDKASLSITGMHDDGRRDIEIDFLSDERHIALPAFSGYRGNPVIIAMLEHIAQSISASSGGGALYVRNRIRDALADEAINIDKLETRYGQDGIVATRLTFYPFTNDKYLSGYPLIRNSKFSIDLSDDVPGGVLKVEVKASHEEQAFQRSLSLL